MLDAGEGVAVGVAAAAQAGGEIDRHGRGRLEIGRDIDPIAADEMVGAREADQPAIAAEAIDRVGISRALKSLQGSRFR